jgi:hypothetical protein
MAQPFGLVGVAVPPESLSAWPFLPESLAPAPLHPGAPFAVSALGAGCTIGLGPDDLRLNCRFIRGNGEKDVICLLNPCFTTILSFVVPDSIICFTTWLPSFL